MFDGIKDVAIKTLLAVEAPRRFSGKFRGESVDRPHHEVPSNPQTNTPLSQGLPPNGNATPDAEVEVEGASWLCAGVGSMPSISPCKHLILDCI